MENCKVLFYCVAIVTILFCGIPVTHGQDEESCPQGSFNPPLCNGTCHCKGGDSECSPTDGFCKDYQCAWGWGGPPFCQEPCPELRFGVNCELTCHCPENDTCHPQDGLCKSGQCAAEWGGASCQTRKVQLTAEPRISDVTCRNFTVSFRAWSQDLDFGDPPIHGYELQYRINGSEWARYAYVVEDGQSRYTYEVTLMNESNSYEFRVTVSANNGGYPRPGVPGPESAAVQPKCVVPTTPVPTTTTSTTPPTVLTTTEPPTTDAPSSSSPTTISTTSVVQTSTTRDVPGPVRNLSAILDRVTGEVVLNWLPPQTSDTAITQYVVRYWRIGIGTCETLTVPGPITMKTVSFTFTSTRLGGSGETLEDFSKYRVTVTANSDIGESETSITEVVTRDVVPLDPVTGVRLNQVFATEAVIDWNELPCDRSGGLRVRYDINFTTETGQILLMTTASAPPYQATRLTPYTDYRVQVRYVNSAGAGPWSSASQLTFRTQVSEPNAPTNVRITAVEDTGLLVNWTEPFPSHGPIRAYQVLYWVEINGQRTQFIQPINSGQTGRWIRGLQPFTNYQVQVQAQTRGESGEEYWGALSESIDALTGDGTPSIPRNLGRTSRNETCITLAWAEPAVPNGIIQKYQLSYRILATSSVSDPDPGITVVDIRDMKNIYVVCNLLPSSQYRFALAASTRTAEGEQAVYESWTVVANPTKPDRPTVVRRSTTSITIQIKPVVLLSGPVTGYYIVVYRPPVDSNSANSIITRQKRQTVVTSGYPDPTFHIPLPGNTVAYVPNANLLDTRWFTAGDTLTWGEYPNPALEPDTKYNIFFVIMSSLDGITKMAYSETEIPPRTRSVVGEDSSDDNLLWIIIGSILGALLLLLLLIILICCCCRKCCNGSSSDKEKLGVQKNTWLEYYTQNFYNSLGGTKNSKKWSDITEFSEPRHVAINEPYNPLDLQVSEIQGGKHLLSFEEEYKHLPVGMLPQYSTRIALRPENQEKNRFDHLLAYDHSRVILKGKKSGGYINATYIDGYHKRSAYIAAQSPFTEETINDFWYMIFQEKIMHIAFLVRLEEDGIIKSEKYWPDGENTIKCGDIYVQHIATDHFANFVVRIFDVHRGRVTRRVFQYHFTVWPDHGTPEDPIPFLEFHMKVSGSIKVTNDAAPLLVHCGTGVSRTAVFIALDSLLQQAKVENCVNVFKYVHKMRTKRTMMVRTLKQYIFLYDILFEALITNYHIVGEDLKVNYRLLSNKNPVTDRSLFREQYDILEKYVPPLIPEKCHDALIDANLKKNRFESIVPPDKYRPILRTPGGRDRTDYINALYIDGYLQAENYIVTQTPLNSTVIDFWKLVWDHNISTIVMLNGTDFKEDTCANYWPATRGQQKYEPFFVNMTHVSQKEHCIVRTFKVTSGLRPSSEAPREVKQFQFESWRMYEKTPWFRDGFIQLTELVEDWQVDSETEKTPILVHCMDGAGQSGLFVAVSIMFEKMREENVVDVFHTVKHLKRRRPHFVNTLEQYKFCFKILWDYMNTRMEKPPMVTNGVAFRNDPEVFYDSFA